MLRIFLLTFGVFCGSTAVIMIKESTLHPSVLAAYRLLLATLFLSPLFLIQLRQYRNEYSWRHVQRSLLPALTLALHFISWAQGAQWTHAANASLIVNMVPVVMPFLLYFSVREMVTKGEIIGTAVSLAGVCLLTMSDFSLSRQHLLGDITCFVSMLLFAHYMAQGRANRDFPTIWLYLVPLYAMAGVICLVISCFVAEPLRLYAPREYWLILGLAVIPTIMGHSILNYSMKHLRGQIVSVFNLCQFLFAGVLAYLRFGEVPQPIFFGAGALVVGGALLVIRASSGPHADKKTDLSTLPLEEAV
ncbi:MAG TPA: DMT family transporter [Abditibacteriaceae bacterium]|jgi:drug/metabolite transporter (DMT)-like permease